MAKYFTIARPYAKAVFSDALDADQLQPWLKVLQTLGTLVENKETEQLVLDPRLSDEACQQLFYDLVQSVLPEDVSSLGDRLKHFIALLTRENRLMVLPDIVVLYLQRLNDHNRVIEAEVICAFPLSEDHREQLKNALGKKFNSNITLRCFKDERLIGGAIVRAGNWVMDGSVRGKLAKLADSISGL